MTKTLTAKDQDGQTISVGDLVYLGNYGDAQDLIATVYNINEDGTLDVEGGVMTADNQDEIWHRFEGVDADEVGLF